MDIVFESCTNTISSETNMSTSVWIVHVQLSPCSYRSGAPGEAISTVELADTFIVLLQASMEVNSTNM